MKALLYLIGLLVVLALSATMASRLAGVWPGGNAAKDGPTGSRSADAGGSESGILYRWRDAKGTLHIESEAPAEGDRGEAIADLELIIYVRRPSALGDGTEADASQGEPAQTTSPSWSRAASGLPPGSLPIESLEGRVDPFEWLDQTSEQLGERHERFEELKEQL